MQAQNKETHSLTLPLIIILSRGVWIQIPIIIQNQIRLESNLSDFDSEAK